MRLADETRLVMDEKTTIYLRPTLRAAMRLERRYGGFDTILRGIFNGSATIIADVIRESADRETYVPDLIANLDGQGLGAKLDRLAHALIPHCMALAGLDSDDFGSKKAKREATATVTFAEHHTRLYQLATGWLGWSPEQAWTATPAEIVEAYKGFVAKHNAINGVSDKGKPKSEGSLADKFRAVFGARGTVKVAA